MASLSEKMPFYGARNSWAKMVSDVLSPPMVWFILVTFIAFEYTATVGEGLYWATIFSVLVCLLPVLYIIYMVRSGKIGDIHMRRREERYKPLMLTVVSALIAYFFLRSQGAPTVFVILSLIAAVQIATILAVTLYWQISMHAMAIAAAVVATAALFNVTTSMILIPFVVLVAAARLHLKCHTPAQILVGTLVGGLVPLAVLAVLPLAPSLYI